MKAKMPNGDSIFFDKDKLKRGDIVGDWQFDGNTTKPGNPIWNEWINIKTGESTLKTYTPQLVPSCVEHYYEFVDNNFNFQCRNCFVGGRLILAYTNIIDGRLVKVASKIN